ncbi:MAG: SDR family oxidoreductase, partial [Candidatus Paceibacterota bacterium]
LAEAYLERRKKLETRDGSRNKERVFKDKTVLITGVSGGIGRATAFLFKKEGYYVYGTDRVDNSHVLGEHEECDKFLKMDLCDEKAVSEIFKEFSKENKKLDALINIAASQICMPFENISSDSWNELMACNLKSPYFLIQTFLPLLKEAKGSIVNISSIHSFQTSADISAYAISKAGLAGLTRSLAIELGKFGIRVNGICPGAIDTPMLKNGLMRSAGDPLQKMEKLAEKHIMGYIGKPEDIANAILFLADNEKARFITGTHLVVDGGATIKLSTE